MNNKMKVIIDTDIGDDIDDAFAILLAMKEKHEIVGVTTVFLNTAERARITKKLLKLYKSGYENVPVYAGYGTPLAKNTEDYPHLCQYTEDIDLDEYTPDSSDPDDAVNFIIESCHKYKEELTIIAIGPFTNMAKVIKKDPTALNSIKKLVIMGGAFYKQYSDWNVICDVEAAKIMFDNVNNIHCLGADVTHKLTISKDDDSFIRESNVTPAAKYVSDIYKMWKGDSDKLGILHDPLAILYALEENVCKCESAPVAVITDGYARGITLNVSEYKKSYLNKAYEGFDFNHTHTLAKEVDRDYVIKKFMECFK